ncbi:MAG: hypothetical protein WAZ27_04180 [Minisyncoccia bacterium]
MFRQTVLALLAFIVVAFIVMWVIGGGPRRSINQIQAIDVLPFSPQGETGFRLPWQPAQLFPTLDLSDALQFEEDGMSPEYQLAVLEEEYDHLNRAASETRTFGNASVHSGFISLVGAGGIRSDEVHDEYLEIAADSRNTTSVDISGWSLESALSGARVYLPGGSASFLMGTASTLGPIALDPGGLAIVSSAASPVGVSFRENSCTGYLSQFQTFNPALAGECPTPSSILPLTEENLRIYGDGCFDVVNSLQACAFPQNLPDTLYASCRTFLADKLSYNGCVQQSRSRSTFLKNMWRVYLGAETELWRNSHDAIRLLDAAGRTVDVFVY